MFPLHPPHVWNLIELDIVEAVSTVEGVFGLGQADHQGLRGPGVDWNLRGWDWINFEPRFSEFPRISSFFTHNQGTDIPAYSDTVYSDTPLTVTLLASPK